MSKKKPCQEASMGLPTGAGRESPRSSLPSLAWESFNGAADRGRQRAEPACDDDRALLPASMGLPTGAGRENTIAPRTGPGATWLQWGCRPGPAERARRVRHGDAPRRHASMGLPTGAGREVANIGRWNATLDAVLQWGCRPGPAESRSRAHRSAPSRCPFNGAADRGRQRAPSARRWTATPTASLRFNGAADRGRQRGQSR